MSTYIKTNYHKVRSCAVLRIAVLTAFLFVIFFPQKVSNNDNTYFLVEVNGNSIGAVESKDDIYDSYREARREMCSDRNGMILVDYPEIVITEKKATFAKISSKKELTENMKHAILTGSTKTYEKSYSVKVNETIVNMKSISDVEQMLNDAIKQYDSSEDFCALVEKDKTRQLSAFTVSVNKISEMMDTEKEIEAGIIERGGIASIDDFDESEIDALKPISLDDYELGVKDVKFKERIEIAEAYVPKDRVVSVENAGKILTENQEVQQIYKVQSGDTLSEISLSVGLPLDDIIAMNPELENENSTIYANQELIITVPKPELSIIWVKETRVNEAYDLPIEYIYNDDWYTNHSVTHVQPSAGYHEAIVSITSIGDEEQSRDTIYEEIKMQPVAKVVEVGTQTPPTYIKPISGGRLSSGFGARSAPKKGASTYHKGIDWATPIGTSVYASCGGTVAMAGWGRGYGNVIYINHPDGRQTRYGHLSKIYVKVGDTVKQGDVIAASGNTGVSTGPHIHFEILINGVQVNPLNYLN